MIITIIAFLLALTAMFIFRKKYGTDDDFSVFGFLTMVTLIISLFLHLITWPIFLEKTTKTYTQKIVTIKNDHRISGEIRGGLFFVRCQINEKDYYIYLTESDGIYKQEKVPVEKTVIAETLGTPRICKSLTFTGNRLPWYIRFKSGENTLTSESDTLYVPVGTLSEYTKYEIF